MRNLSGSGWPGFERPLFSCRSGAKSSLTARCRSLPVLPPFPFFGDLQSLSSPWLGLGRLDWGRLNRGGGLRSGWDLVFFRLFERPPGLFLSCLTNLGGG